MNASGKQLTSDILSRCMHGQRRGPPDSRHSFVVRKSGRVGLVDWIVAPHGYRSFRVGIDPISMRVSYIYCRTMLSNEQAAGLLRMRGKRPGPVDEASWNWRDLDDFV